VKRFYLLIGPTSIAAGLLIGAAVCAFYELAYWRIVDRYAEKHSM